MTFKPENLIAINKDEKFSEIKIVDFGLAEDISTNPGFNLSTMIASPGKVD